MMRFIIFIIMLCFVNPCFADDKKLAWKVYKQLKMLNNIGIEMRNEGYDFNNHYDWMACHDKYNKYRLKAIELQDSIFLGALRKIPVHYKFDLGMASQEVVSCVICSVDGAKGCMDAKDDLDKAYERLTAPPVKDTKPVKPWD